MNGCVVASGVECAGVRWSGVRWGASFHVFVISLWCWIISSVWWWGAAIGWMGAPTTELSLFLEGVASGRRSNFRSGIQCNDRLSAQEGLSARSVLALAS